MPVDETRAAEASWRVDRLESALKDYRRELDQVRQENAQLRRDLRDVTQRGRQPPLEATAAGNQGQRLSSSWPSAPDSTPLVPSTPPPTSGGRSRVCYGCGSSGHVVEDCPSGRRGARGTQWPEQSETYVELDFCGTRHRCLLDTGCEKSLVPRKLIPTAVLSPTELKVYAANGTAIPILGTVRLGFSIISLSSSVDLLVSDCVDEMMLGVDFLTQHNCRWYFDRKQIDIDGQVVPL